MTLYESDGSLIFRCNLETLCYGLGQLKYVSLNIYQPPVPAQPGGYHRIRGWAECPGHVTRSERSQQQRGEANI